jgi:hypothetical protein
MTMIAERAAVLRRRARPWPQRHAAFVSLAHGFIHENGTVVRWRERASLSLILEIVAGDEWGDQAPTVVYLVGGWDAASTPATEWFTAPEGWRRTTYNRDPLIAIYKPLEGRQGHKVTLYATAQWFGTCGSASLCQRAYTRLRALLRATFDPGADLLGTPARTGLDLLERSLPRNRDGQPYEYPVLDAEFREMIEHNIGQGRMEFLPVIGGATGAMALYILDASWMYAACVRHLAAPPMQHDREKEFAGYRCGFYLVDFQVPEGWRHIGLLPTWDAKARAPVYPCVADGRWHCAVATGEELRLAIEQGWPVEISERWLFADDRASNADPSRTWAEHLRMLRAACTDEREGKIAPLLRAALRALLIKAVGGLHRRGRVEQVETPHERAEDVDPSMVLEVTPSVIRWMRPIPLAPEMAGFNHPEWAALIWGRARARLARAALRLPREQIIALRSDALVTTVDPHWPDDGRPGTFRVKRVISLADGRGLPQDERQYRRLLRGADDA